jgi:hypothetical protein
MFELIITIRILLYVETRPVILFILDNNLTRRQFQISYAQALTMVPSFNLSLQLLRSQKWINSSSEIENIVLFSYA